ncbi:MAG: MFS transporter [Planctomycetaceae bacterium]|nr:MFS transporter [Planctomycetales bacterium]MCB9924468.1 MFS transporter [Planctomycetaceae bacterium]
MNFLATPIRRKFLFFSLYLSEGAPIGFIWLALPTRLRAGGVEIVDITWLTAILVLPWTFKFMWAPLIDLLRGPSWTLRHWIVAAQLVMGVSLLPLIWLEPISRFHVMAALLFVHTFAAATQDVAIDALCISSTSVSERGQYNGWMQAGMLVGRAIMGGGALVMARSIGDTAVIALLVLITTFSILLVIVSRASDEVTEEPSGARRFREVWGSIKEACAHRNMWLGLSFAMTGGAAFKSLEVIYGPFLVDRGYDKAVIGWFSAGPMIIAMMVGSLVGGWLADRAGHRISVMSALVYITLSITGLAFSDLMLGAGPHLLVLLAVTAFGIGLFTASSYALFMDITRPAITATEFSAFMGATNGCEPWSSYAIGALIKSQGYPFAMLAMCSASLVALPLLAKMKLGRKRTESSEWQ